MRATVLILAVLALSVAVPAFAGPWELGVYGGYAWLDEYGGFNPENKFFPGVRLGKFLGSRTSLEFSAQKISTESEFDDPLLTNTDLDLASYRLNLLYHLSGGGVRPFITVGIGSEGAKAEEAVSPLGPTTEPIESSDFGWNVGGGLRFMLSDNVNMRVDGRFVNAKASDFEGGSQGNGEASVGLSFLFGGGHHEEVSEVAPVETAPPPNGAPSVTCAADRAEVLPGETVNLRATASDPEGGPLTYEWTAASGHVTGNGAAATLDFAGMSAPASASVTVRVTDDHNNSATSDCSVRLMEPAKQAEAVSCTAGGFPKNLSRVGNVDKACLDDVAQRLGGDPRAHVVVVGHVETSETASGLGMKRADAVKAYLVRERNIDATRVTIRAASGPDSEGRRVEVWFVPDGAADPQ